MSQRAIYTTTFDEDEGRTTTASCPDCDGRVTTNQYETVCDACGLVIRRQEIDHGPEWRSFETETRKRTGAPRTPARHDRGLSTNIASRMDGNGNELSPETRRKFARLRRHHDRAKVQSKRERNQRHGFTEIRRLVSQRDLGTSFRDMACRLFERAQKADLLVGRSIEAMAAASVYAVCRIRKRALSRSAVVAMARCDRTGLENAYTALNVELALPIPPREPAVFVPRIAADVESSNETRQRARTLAEAAADAGVANGRCPSGVAAACLRVAAVEHEEAVTQKALADAADVASVTVRTNENRLHDELGCAIE